MCLTFGRLPLEDKRVSYGELYGAGVLTFGTYPALQINGRPINQIEAMAKYAGHVSGFYPVDPWLGAKVDEMFDALTDATFCTTKTQNIKNMEVKAQVRADMMRPGGKLNNILSGLDSLLVQNGRNGFCAGNAVSVGDFAAWRFINWLCSGIVVGVDPDMFDKCFPELVRLFSRIDALPEVQDWKRRHPEFYETPEARWKSWRPYSPAPFLMKSNAISFDMRHVPVQGA